MTQAASEHEPSPSHRGALLGERGYRPDPGRVERTAGTIAFYHYTRRDALASILDRRDGLRARLPVACSEPPAELANGYLVEGFLEPMPRWLGRCPYFGDLGLALMRQYVGDTLLRIELPDDFPGLYVADYAHVLACKHVDRHGRPGLELGYDCRTGHASTQAYVDSYVPAGSFTGGHVAPVMQVVRKGPGRAVPVENVALATVQPLLDGGS